MSSSLSIRVSPILVRVFLFNGSFQSDFRSPNEEMQKFITEEEGKGFALVSATPTHLESTGSTREVFMSVTVIMKKV